MVRGHKVLLTQGAAGVERLLYSNQIVPFASACPAAFLQKVHFFLMVTTETTRTPHVEIRSFEE
ncbi:MAG: hypothetical protein ACJA0U_000573 [Salibacteraceae bacterium]|jgi:hypothetical protein